MNKPFKKITFEALGSVRVGYMEPIYPNEVATWAVALIADTAVIKSIEIIDVDYELAKVSHMNNLINYHNKVKSYAENDEDKETNTIKEVNDQVQIQESV